MVDSTRSTEQPSPLTKSVGKVTTNGSLLLLVAPLPVGLSIVAPLGRQLVPSVCATTRAVPVDVVVDTAQYAKTVSSPLDVIIAAIDQTTESDSTGISKPTCSQLIASLVMLPLLPSMALVLGLLFVPSESNSRYTRITPSIAKATTLSDAAMGGANGLDGPVGSPTATSSSGPRCVHSSLTEPPGLFNATFVGMLVGTADTGSRKDSFVGLSFSFPPTGGAAVGIDVGVDVNNGDGDSNKEVVGIGDGAADRSELSRREGGVSGPGEGHENMRIPAKSTPPSMAIHRQSAKVVLVLSLPNRDDMGMDNARRIPLMSSG